MIKSIKIVHKDGKEYLLPLAYPYDTGIAITRIDGLGLGQSSVSTTPKLLTDGSKYNGSRIDNRSLVITTTFVDWNQSIETIRLKTYKIFPLKTEIKIVVETANRLVYINGVVEANEPDIFSENEGNTITINCPIPYFRNVVSNSSVYKGIQSLFEFPFSNESLTDDLIFLSEIIDGNHPINIYNNGDEQTGLIIKMNVESEYGLSCMIRNNTSKSHLSININVPVSGKIEINTNPGNKSIKFIDHQNVVHNYNKYIVIENSEFINLVKGDNNIEILSNQLIDVEEIKLDFDILYGGV